MKTSWDQPTEKFRLIGWLVWKGIKFWAIEKRSDWRVWREEKLGKFGKYEKEVGFGHSKAGPQCNGSRQVQRNKKML